MRGDERQKASILDRAASEASTRRYAAFISYSHADEEIANWLHRRLEGYVIPKALGRGRRLGKVFRDRVELSAAHDLGGEIKRALDVSDALIVLCSPRAAGSRYVAEEILHFKQLGRETRIFAVIVDGEPHAAGKPGRDASEECFPRALLYRVGADGQLSSEPEAAEPIAADVREGRDGRESGALKLISGLLDVGLDELVMREKQAERARQRRVQLVAAVMGILALGAASAGGFAVWQRGVAEKERDRASTNERIALDNEKTALAATERAKKAEQVAESERDSARNALYKSYGTEAWNSLDDDDPVSAMRYALAGLRLSPANAAEYADALARAMHDYGEVRTLMKVDTTARGLAVSQDGRRLVQPRGDSALVKRIPDGRVIATLKGRPGRVEWAGFSADGSRVVTTHSGHGANVWEAATGRLIASSADHQPTVDHGKLSADGGRGVFLCGSSSRQLCFWDVSGGQPMTVIARLENPLNLFAISPDGKQVAMVRVLDIELRDADNMAAAPIVLPSSREIVTDISYLPDDEFLPEDGAILMTSLESGAVVIQDHGGGDPSSVLFAGRYVAFARLSPDAERVMTAGTWDGSGAKIWTRTGVLLATLPGWAGRPQFTTEGDVLTVGGGELRLWTSLGRAEMPAQSWFLGDIRHFAISRDGRRAAAAGPQTSHTIDLRTGDHETDFLDSSQSRYIAFHLPDGDGEPVWVEPDGIISRGDYNDYRAGDASLGYVRAAAISSDGRKAALVREGGAIEIWSTASERRLGKLAGKAGEKDNLVAFSANGELLVTAGGATRIWNARTGVLVLPIDDAKDALSVQFSEAGDKLLTVHGNAVKIWNLTDGQLVRAILLTERSAKAVMTPNGRLIVTGEEKNGALSIWNADTGRHIARLSIFGDSAEGDATSRRFVLGYLTTESRSLAGLALSPDGRNVFAAFANGSVLRWDVSRILQAQDQNAVDACLVLSAESARRFTSDEFEATPLLAETWSADRDVCEGVATVTPLPPRP